MGAIQLEIQFEDIIPQNEYKYISGGSYSSYEYVAFIIQINTDGDDYFAKKLYKKYFKRRK